MRKARGLSGEELRKFRGKLLRHSDAFDDTWRTALRLAAPFATAAEETARGGGSSRGGSGGGGGSEGGGGGTTGAAATESRYGRVGGLLISGATGGGRSSFAAQLAAACNFSFVQVSGLALPGGA